MKHTVERLNKGITSTKSEIIASSSGKGANKRLYINIYYDGNGWADIEFIVEDHGEIIGYTTYDAAVDRYNEGE